MHTKTENLDKEYSSKKNHFHPHKTFHHQQNYEKRHQSENSASTTSGNAKAPKLIKKKRITNSGEINDVIDDLEESKIAPRLFKMTRKEALPKEILVPDAITIASFAQLLKIPAGTRSSMHHRKPIYVQSQRYPNQMMGVLI
jgi:hypothetical protein